MSADDLTPERLDAILDGSEPATDDADRDMLALAATLRGAAPPASDGLRARVRAIAGETPAGGRSDRRNPGWRARLLIAGPALATVVAAVVVIAVVGGDSGTNRTNLASGESTATAPTSGTGGADATARSSSDALKVAPSSAPRAAASAGPVILRVEGGTLQRRVAEARRIVTRAGGNVVATPQSTAQPTAQPGTLLTVTLPPERAAEAIAELGALGEVTGGALDPAPDGTLRLLLTERP
jgi:hypothetical protein